MVATLSPVTFPSFRENLPGLRADIDVTTETVGQRGEVLIVCEAPLMNHHIVGITTNQTKFP